MRKVIIILSVGLLTMLVVVYSLYNKQHRSVEDEEAIRIDATDLFTQFETNEVEANKRYLNKVLEVTGVVSEISKNQAGKPVIVLSADNPMFGIICTVENEIKNIQVGVTVTMKGICTGYLSDVVITNGIRVSTQNATP